MKYSDTLKALAAYGTGQNRKIYVRHGANPANVYGVSFANLGKLVKQIKQDHSLAYRLWQSGNYDARNLATKLANPASFSLAEAEDWVKDIDNHLHAGLLGGVLAQNPNALKLAAKWTSSKVEYICETGYSLLGSLVKLNSASLPVEAALEYLAKIERDIHKSPNWVRYGMNWALISLGTYKDELMEAAIEAAERIGQVEVDHGETSCKTPLAAPYIRKAFMKRKEKERNQAMKREKLANKR